MSPETIAKPGTEHSHQSALFCWSNQQTQWPEIVWLYAVPNGGERGAATAGRLKAEGVKSGVSDTCLPVARRGYHGLYLEMKKPGGTESANQKKFGAFVKEEGYFYACCDDWTLAAKTIAWYLGREDGGY